MSEVSRGERMEKTNYELNKQASKQYEICQITKNLNLQQTFFIKEYLTCNIILVSGIQCSDLIFIFLFMWLP